MYYLGSGVGMGMGMEFFGSGWLLCVGVLDLVLGTVPQRLARVWRGEK